MRGTLERHRPRPRQSGYGPRRLSSAFRWLLAPIALLLPVCGPPRTAGVFPTPTVGSFRLELPASIERERSGYEADIAAGIERVTKFFRSAGLDLPGERLIESAVVFETTAEAREVLAAQAGAPLESVPATFSGTVDGRRLVLVSREAYRESWHALYKEWPWTETAYRQLIVHELAHRAHEAVAISRYGSAEAMGPTWFFEGLAVVCAGQFETGQPPMGRDEIERAVGDGRTPAVSYPLYGRLVRSLGAEFGVNVLVVRASRPGFPEGLWSEPAVRAPKDE